MSNGRPPKNVASIRGLVIPRAPRCICGCLEYFYTNYGEVVRARCKKCRYDRYFNSISEKWGPLD